MAKQTKDNPEIQENETAPAAVDFLTDGIDTIAVNDSILNSINGYYAVIEGKIFATSKAEYGKITTIDGQEQYGLKKKGSVMMPSENGDYLVETGETVFTNITPYEAKVLADAGVISLSDVHREMYLKARPGQKGS